MEFKFSSKSPYSYIKYDGYNGVHKDTEYYMVPKPEETINARGLYDIFSKIDNALVDLLNVGRLCLDDDRENVKFATTLFFVEQYGLLGFMTEAPINDNFLLNDKVVLKEGNFISKKNIMKTSEYFDLFFPFANKEEMSYSVSNNEVTINSNSDLQKLLRNTSINNQLIYSGFYCEQIDWIVEYAKKMYKIFKSIIEFSDMDSNSYDLSKAKDIIDNYHFVGVPCKIVMHGSEPTICWQPNSLKQALDLAFGFIMCDEKNPIKECKHCGKIFLSKNPKAEYCSPQCRNKANVYKSREKNK